MEGDYLDAPSWSNFRWGSMSRQINKKYYSRNKFFDLADKTITEATKIKEIEKCLSKVIVLFLVQFDSVDELCGMNPDTRNRMPFPRKLWKYCEAKWRKTKGDAALFRRASLD